MRILSHILIGIVILFLGNALLYIAFPGYQHVLRNMKVIIDGKLSGTDDSTDAGDDTSAGMIQTPQTVTTPIIVTTTKRQLSDVFTTGSTLSGTITNSSSGKTEAIDTGATIAPAPTDTPVIGGLRPDIALPPLFLKKTSALLHLQKTDNTAIFGISPGKPLAYTTYTDDASHIRVFAFDVYPDTVTGSLVGYDSLYTLKKAQVFFGNTVFFNKIQSDGIIRCLIGLSGRAVAVEMPQAFYPSFRKAITGK